MDTHVKSISVSCLLMDKKEDRVSNPGSSRNDISPTSSIENFGSFKCNICSKKVKSTSRVKHAVKHYPDFIPDELIKKSNMNLDKFVCQIKDCNHNCLEVLHMKQHYAIAHGELEKNLNKKGKTIFDLYLTKKPRASKKFRSSSTTNLISHQNHALKPISLNQLESETNSQVNLEKSLEPAEDLPSLKPQTLKDCGTHVKDDTNVKPGINDEGKSDLEVKLRLELSDISNDAFFDEEDSNSTQLQVPDRPNLQDCGINLYAEIDTEAETDVEDAI